MFTFLDFCFKHWACDREFLDVHAQFDVFRNHLTVLAGYYLELYNIKGELRIEAVSLSYSGMNQAEFEQLYNALVNAALKHIFFTTDENTHNQLLSFF